LRRRSYGACGRADHRASFREAVVAFNLSYTEIDQLCLAIWSNHDVSGIYVAVESALAMTVLQRV
jgi:hypothetical protein